MAADERPLLDGPGPRRGAVPAAVSVRRALRPKGTTAGEAAGYLLVRATGWLPLLLSLAADGALLAYTAAFVAAWANVFCFSFAWYDAGRTRSWPKTLDIAFIVVTGVFTMLAWYLPKDGVNRVHTLVYDFSDAMVCGGLAVGVGAAWALGYPFIRSHVADSVDEEGIGHPVLKHFVRRLTAMWLLVFSLMAVVTLVPAIIHVEGDDDGTAKTICLVSVYIILAFGLLATYWLYPAYFDKHIDEVADLYPKEMEMWNAEHPDHEYAPRDEEVGKITN